MDFRLQKLDVAGRSGQIGNKAASLYWLAQHGQRIPKTYVFPYQIENHWRTNPQGFKEYLNAHLRDTLDFKRPYAVRSSANLEDGDIYSFAGQFKTVLDVDNPDALTNAVINVLESKTERETKLYLGKTNQADTEISLGVIIQEMIDPKISGVTFSRNPLTGLDEIVIEFVQGRGDALVQEGVTPERWVQKWGTWITRPLQTNLDEHLLDTIASDARRIESQFGGPVDIEWVFNGHDLYIVQVRKITSLKDFAIYSNRIAREVLPGLIKPLPWSVSVPIVNSAWVDLFTEFIGPNEVNSKDLARSFHFRTYFNMGTIGKIFQLLGMPQESLEILMGFKGGENQPRFKPGPKTYSLMPRMLRVGLQKLRYGKHFSEKILPELQDKIYNIRSEPVEQFSPDELLQLENHLTTLMRRVAYNNIVVPLLNSIFNFLLRRQLTRRGIEYERLDITHNLEGLENYDPSLSLADLRCALNVDATQYPDLQDVNPGDFPAALDWAPALRQFLANFGHLSENGNDFSVSPWRENPEFVMQMAANYQPAEFQSSRQNWEELSLNWLERTLLGPLYRQVRQFRLHREAISSLYVLGNSQFRRIYLRMGEHLVNLGFLRAIEDIFYLESGEVRQCLQNLLTAELAQERVQSRRQRLEASRNAELPEIIYGNEEPPLQMFGDQPDRLTGIPSSGGYFQGKVCVVREADEFHKLSPRDVLVIPYSDIAWTPLFARAGAVIAEAGGILSHSSIVAREYQIPCVVSVDGATRLTDGEIVTVDGYQGRVIRHQPVFATLGSTEEPATFTGGNS